MQVLRASIPQFSALLTARGRWLAVILPALVGAGCGGKAQVTPSATPLILQQFNCWKILRVKPQFRNISRLILPVFALLMAACGGGRDAPTETPTPTAAANVAVEATRSPEPSATPSPTPSPTPMDLPPTRYRLTAELNFSTHHVRVDEQITYYNPAPEPLSELPLMVEALYFPGTFNLNAITWEDGTAVEDYSRDGARLRITLPQPLEPGERVGLALNYELQLPSPVPSAEVRPIPFGHTLRQTNLVDWYPFIPPYKPGSGWLAHDAGYFGEHLAYELADFEVDLYILDERTDLVVAASAPGQFDGDWWHYQLEGARNFAVSVSPEYRVYTTTVGSTTVLSYAFGFHEAAGQAVLDTTAQALGLYNELFGEYPRPQVSAVEADFLDGMEYDGLYFLSNGFYNLYQGTPGEYLTAIAAHETAHQWFYARVGNDQALEPWLDEALCTYAERLFYERLHPEALDWWWEYRVNYYDPRGAVDGPIYNTAGYRAYRDAVYLNGAVFLEALRERVGDGAFFGFLKDYVEQMSGRIATREDFFNILNEHTQADISPLVGEYFEGR